MSPSAKASAKPWTPAPLASSLAAWESHTGVAEPAPLHVVPDLGQLLAEPDSVDQLNAAECRRLAPSLAALLVTVLVRAGETTATVPVVERPDEAVWLNAYQVEQRFGLTKSWLEEHRTQLRRLGLMSTPSRKTLLYDSKRLKAFLEARRG